MSTAIHKQGFISEGSETATATFANRPTISDQATSQVDTTESSPAVYQHETASSPPQATYAEQEASQLGVDNGAPTSETSSRSTEPLSPPSSPSPIRLHRDNGLGPDLDREVTPQRRSGRSVAGGTIPGRLRTRECYQATAHVAISEEIGMRADTCSVHSAPQPSPPPTDHEDTPTKVLIGRVLRGNGFRSHTSAVLSSSRGAYLACPSTPMRSGWLRVVSKH